MTSQDPRMLDGRGHRPFGSGILPPLQHGRSQMSQSGRPLPLEPSTSLHSSHGKLTARPKPLDDSSAETEEPQHHPRQSPSTRASPDSGDDSHRKKPRTDSIHLPLVHEGRPVGFRRSSTLNILDGPLLPPIGSAIDAYSNFAPPPSSTGSSSPTASSPSQLAPKAKAKRQCLRGRLKWTENETNDLLKGVTKYGIGKWKKILMDPEFHFQKERTMVDLKDRFRTCRMNEEKARERATVEAAPGGSPTDTRPPLWQAGNGASGTGGSEPVFDVTTPSGYKESLQSPKSKRGANVNPWTPEEDEYLSAGYSCYGFQWTAITRDPQFHLTHRSGAQVRDRFRMKYPEIYSSTVPLPLPDSLLPAPQVHRKSLSKGKDRTKLEFIMQNPQSSRLPPLQASGSRLPAAYEATPLTPSNGLPDRFSGFTLSEPDLDDGSSGPVSPEALDQDQSEQSAVDAEEVRDLSILGLLNHDDSHHNTLPPLQYPYDDWDPASPGDVTLPPLSKLDDKQKGLFDLE